MNEIFELAGLETKLAFVLAQIIAIIERRRTIAHHNATDRVEQEMQSEKTFVGVVGIEAGQDGRHELYDMHLGLLTLLVKSIVSGELARHRNYHAQNRGVTVRFGEALQTLVDHVDERRQHDLAAQEGQILEGFFRIAVIRLAEYGREYDTTQRLHEFADIHVRDKLRAIVHRTMIPFRALFLLSIHT